jgi:3-hydroxybutyryl-CoA dehydrogenase
MLWAVNADEFSKQELVSNGLSKDVRIEYVKNAEEFARHQTADGFIDLLFTYSDQRIELLKKFLPKPVIVNSVEVTLKKMNAPFVRINAWPGFLKRSIVEASYGNDNLKRQAEAFFLSLNKQMRWVDDKPGFITPRVIAMIINEAWNALGEGVSTKDEIDTAMKLGVNYPHGPFEWCQQIGIKNIYNLLIELGKMNARYRPAALLAQEVTAQWPSF